MEPLPEPEPMQPDLEPAVDYGGPDQDLHPAQRQPDIQSGGPGTTPPRRNVGMMAGVVAVAALVVGGMLATFGSPKPAGDETAFANWGQHVAGLNELNVNNADKVVKHVNRGGQAFFVTDVALGDQDEDPSTTQAVQEALQQNDIAAATAALQEAQQIPPVMDQQGEPLPRVEPEVTTGMKEAIADGDARFYHIYLFDSCDEDGDVVRILLNGEAFAVVPITHQGVTLSVPVGGGGTTIELEGVRDGGGGITVACRTSGGDYFTSAMAEGEIQLIGLTR